MTTILQNYPQQTIPLSRSDRLQQTYIIGANGVGKSTTLLKLILRDIQSGLGVCVIDPHGDLIKDVISCMQGRFNDVVLLSLTNAELPFGLNLFHCPDPANPVEVQNTVSMVLNIFEKVYGMDRNTMARIINYLQALIYLFIHNPHLTVLDIPSVLDPSKDSEMLRLRLVQQLPMSPAYNYTRYFWTTYYNQRGYFGRDEELAGIFNKFREMTSVLLYPLFCQKNTVDFSSLMAERKIVLVKLNSDWQEASSLVGSIIISQILHAGYVRRHKYPFFVYCDEFQNFATKDFARLYAEARKFNIGITVSHQTLQQVPEYIQDVVLQNAGTLMVFRVGHKDARELAGNFHIEIDPAWIQNIERESIEELRPVEHKRVEEEYEDGERPVRIAKFNVIDHLLNVGHQDNEVMRFVFQYLQFLKDETLVRLDMSDYYIGVLLHEQQKLTEDLECLNNMMHLTMRFQNVPSANVLADITKRFADKLGFEAYQNLLGSGEEQKLIGELSEEVIKQEERYHRFYSCLQNMFIGLADTPILVDSGQWEPRMRKQINYLTDPPLTLTHPRVSITHPERMVSDIEAEFINGLSGLCNYLACVKTRSGEYLVQTTPPPAGVSERDFRKRLRYIQAHNLTDGFVRKREDVEKKILDQDPLLPNLSSQAIQPHRLSPASPMKAPPPLPQSRKNMRQRKTL